MKSTIRRLDLSRPSSETIVANGHHKNFAQRYGEVMIGVFCTLGSMAYIRQLPWQYPFAHKAEVAALKTELKENTAQTAAVKQEASTAVTVAKEAKRANPTDAELIAWRAETDRRQQADRRDINKIKKRLGIP